MADSKSSLPRARPPLRRVMRAIAVFQRSLIYLPARDASLNINPTIIQGARNEPIRLTTPDNLQLNGWRITAGSDGRNAGDDDREWSHRRPLILYFCGNAGNRSYRADVFDYLAELEADVICFDYRGYGDNAGSPSEAAIANDARAIWSHLIEDLHVEPQRVILFGESLGGGVATKLAAEISTAGTPVGGLVLRSTFTRLTDVAACHYPWLPVRWIMLDRYPSVDRIGEVTCPILIFHGRRDTIIPFEQAEQLLAAAPGLSSSGFPPRFVALETADHNDVLSTELNAFRAGMREFVETVNPRVARRQVRQEKPMLPELIRKLTYFPDRADDLSPGTLRLPADRIHAIHVKTDDGLTLNGWHFLAKDHSADDRAGCDRVLAEGRPVVLFFSGNGGHRAYRVPEAGILTRSRADVFLFDYRGYGDNAGTPAEDSLAADAAAVWRYATEERQVAPTRIVLYGESLGGAVAARLAAEVSAAGTPPAGLVLRSTFSSLADVGRHHYPFVPIKMLMVERYDSVGQIAKVTCPILVLHGTRDTIVPYALGRKLFEAAPAASTDGTSKTFVPLSHSDHNDVLESDTELLQEAVMQFLDRVACGK
jgi:hypothetical protein